MALRSAIAVEIDSDRSTGGSRRVCQAQRLEANIMTASELQAAILATQKQIANTMSPMRKRDLQRHLARLRRKLRAVERGNR